MEDLKNLQEEMTKANRLISPVVALNISSAFVRVGDVENALKFFNLA